MLPSGFGPAVSDSPAPQVSFLAFVYSLVGNAAVHFGDMPDPASGETRPPNADAAAQVIDLLALLEQKTRGNLTPEERQFLEQALYELRLRFVQVKAGVSGPATP
jgi:hypothetical protein